MDRGDGRPVERLDLATVVRATPIEGGDFIDRLDGYLSAGEASERYDLQGSLRRLLPQRYFYLGFLGLTSNTELDLDLRTLAGGGYGRYFVQTNLTEWQGGVGLAYSQENYRGGEVFDSLEAVLTTEFSVFR